MPSTLQIHYRFRFHNGETIEIPLHLDEDTLTLLPLTEHAPPLWTETALHQCKGCPLDPGVNPNCPTAVHLGGIVEIFHDHNSYDEVTVEVNDGRRSYLKDTSLQDGLGSLVGIIMATGGCPVLKPLRPMVRFHLPFASLEETEFRMVSMYLVAQYIRQKKGGQPDWSLDGLQAIYDRVQDVNKSFADRIRSASGNDAGVNAIVILDCFARAVPFAIRTMMRDYEKYFDSYS